MRTADTLTSIREAARGGLQGLDLEEESDTFNKEPAITLDTIPVRNLRDKVEENMKIFKKTQPLCAWIYSNVGQISKLHFLRP